MEKVEKEVKVRIAVRRPPGDSWKPMVGDENVVVPSLTDALEVVYQETGKTQFYIDAREGYVYLVDTEEIEVAPTPEKKWSLYGDE